MKYKKKINMGSEDYRNKLSTEEKDYLDKFNYDYNFGGAYSEDSVLSDDGKTEGKSNHRSYKEDALTVASSKGLLSDLSAVDRQFMEDACDAWDWQREYKDKGYRAAVIYIYEQTEFELDNKFVDTKVTLTRFYEKMNQLRKMYSRDRKQKRDGNVE